MPRSRCASLAGAVFWLLALAVPAAGQVPSDQPQPTAPAPTPPPAPPPPEEAPPPAPPAPEGRPVTTPEEPLPSPEPGVAAPPTFLGIDFFNPPPHRGWITLTPAISLSGEYNDNIFLTTRNETDDIITAITPGFTLSMQRPHYRFLAGYNFTAELYAEETDNNDVAKRQQLFADWLYRFNPNVTLTLSEIFIFDRESNVVTTSGISVGRRDSYRNTVTPNLRWQATPRTSVNLNASYTLLRFQEEAATDARDSDTYRVGLGFDHNFTPLLGGGAGLSVGILDVDGEPSATTYSPDVGFSYQLTRSLRLSASAGPSFFVREDESTITPAASLGMEQLYRSGSLRIVYNRSVTAEAIGAADRQAVFASLRFPRLRRGWDFGVTARYTQADEDIENTGGRRIDVVTVNVRVAYQIARNISVTGSYVYFNQTGDVEDVDQNRVFLGLQYAYPINFD